MTDPWYDYLAIPVAPLLLVVQIAALFVRPAFWRWGISAACTVAIIAMLLYVTSIPVEREEGANIGAGVLFLWLLVSFALLAVGLVREVIGFTVREVRSGRRGDRAF